MKKTYNFLMSVAVAAMAFIGCTNTEISIDNNPAPAPVEGTYHQLTFAADSESDASRTHHTGETIYWSKGDRIRIGYTRDGVWQNAEGNNSKESAVTAKLYASSEAHEDAELAKFRVTILFKDTELKGEHIFYGLYPSEITKNNAPDFADNTNSGTINVYLPYIQSPTATSFDPKADLLVSKSLHTYDRLPIATKENEETGTPEREGEEISMRWKRLVAHGQITLKNLLGAGMVEGEKISFVEFTVDEGVNLTGDFTLTLNTADPDQPHKPTITSKSGSKNNKVRLSFAENTEYNTLIDADNDGTKDDFVVWFATAPFTFTEINVEIGTDRAIYTRKITGTNKEFKVNTRSRLGINMGLNNMGLLETKREPLPAWELLTDINNLAVGNFVVIAAADYDVAMSTTQNTNNRGQAAITKSGTSITIGSDVQVLKVEAGTVENTWAFKDENASGYLYAASSSKNYLRTQETNNDNGSWTITVTNNVASIVAQGTNTHNVMRYNDATNNGHLFSCYESGQKDISIYYISALPTTLGTPVILNATEVEAKSVLVEWEEVENALYYSIKCQKDGTTTDKGIVIFKNITDTSFVADNLSDGTWNITVTAYGDGYYSNTSDSASITVTGVTPTVEAEPTELTFTSAGGTQTIEVTHKNLGDSVEITAESSNDAFEVSVEGTTVTVTAGANATGAEISGTITITANGTTTVATSVAVSQEAKPEGERTYTKIDKYLADFSGQYLIVYEGDENHTSVAFDGSLAELDAAVNNKSVTITDGTITLSAAEDLFYFTIEKVEGGYTIKSSNANGHYIGQTANDNGMATGTDAYINTISYSNEGIVIKASSATATYLRYNYTDSETTGKRFRYYKSGQQPIQLYRLEGTGNDETLTQLATPTNVEAEVNNVNTISVTWTTVPNADSYTVTCGEAKQTVNTNNATFEGLSYNTEYVISVVANPAANSTEYYASEPGTASVTTGEDPNEGGNTGGEVVKNTVTYTVSSITACTTSGTAPTGSTAAYQNTYTNNKQQLTEGHTATFTLSGYAGATIKAITLNMRSNKRAGAGKFSVVAGSTTLASISSATNFNKWYDNTSFGTDFRDVNVTLTNDNYVIQSSENVVIKLEATTNSIYINSITIEYEIAGGNAGGGDTPATPTQLTMSEVSCTAQTENSLTFSWSAVAGATGYQVSTDGETYSATQTETTYTWSGLSASTTKTLYVKAIGDGVNHTNSDAVSAEGTTSAASSGGAKTYSFTILPSNFNSTSYAANNNSKTSTATATDGSTMQVSWTSNQVMLQSGVMQWQKSKGYIYNTTDLGTIKSITVSSSEGTFTQYINSSQKPTSNGTGGYFQIQVGSATGKVSSIKVTFEK